MAAVNETKTPTQPAPAPSPRRSLSLIATALRVARIAPFHALRGRRSLALGILSMMPAAVALVLLSYGKTSLLGVRGFVDFQVNFYFVVATPLTMLFLGAGAIGDDIEDGTVLYLRLRPIPRGGVVLGRFLALWLSGFALLLPGVVSLYLITIGHRGFAAIVETGAVLVASLGILALATACYGAFFLLTSLLLRHAVLVGLFVITVWEAVVANLPVAMARGTVSFHSSALLSRVTDEGTELTSWLSRFAETGLIPSPSSSALGLSIAAVVMVALAAQVFARREYIGAPGDS